MANIPEFKYAPMFQLGEDKTEYYLLTKDYVSVGEFEGKPMLKVAPEALTLLAQHAFRDVSFMGQTIPFELLETDGPVTAGVWKHCVIMTAPRKTNVSYRLVGEQQDTKVVDGWMGVCLK